MALPFALDPATFATLQSTLGPAGALNLAQAQELEQQKQLQSATSQATTEANQAQTAYQGAAAAPIPEPDALSQFLPALMGGIASVVSRDPAYREHAENEINQRRKNLVQARLDNLGSLKDAWDKKAAAASRANDLEQEITSRQKSEQLSRAMQQMLVGQQGENAIQLEKLRQKGDIETEKLRGKNALDVANVKANATGLPAGTGESDYIQLYDMPDGSKVPYVDVSQVKGQKIHDALVAYAKSNKLPTVDTQTAPALQMIKSVRGDIQSITNDIIPLLGEGGGLKRLYGGAKRGVEQFLQTPGEGATLAAYPATRTAAIKTIQALASLGKGLRISQAEIKAAQEFDYPKITDTQETATKKFAILGMMMNHIEQAVLGKPPSNAEVAQVLKAVRELNGTTPKVIRYDKNGKRLN